MEHFTEIGYRQSPPIVITRHKTANVQQKEIAQMHWDITKLRSLGVSEEVLRDTMPLQAKGLLYLREMYGSN